MSANSGKCTETAPIVEICFWRAIVTESSGLRPRRRISGLCQNLACGGCLRIAAVARSAAPGQAAMGRLAHLGLAPDSISSLGGISRVSYTVDGREGEAAGRCMAPPAVFCLDENPAGTLAFIVGFREVRLLKLPLKSRLNRSSRGQRGPRWIGTYTDIAAIHTITPTAGLVLAAEFGRSHRRRLLGRRGIVNARDWTRVSREC